MTPEESLYRNSCRWLETTDEHLEYWNHPNQGRWRISRLDLPVDVLERVDSGNGSRILSPSKRVDGSDQ